VGRASMKNQVQSVLKEINYIGHSKREARLAGVKENIHSIKYYRDVQGTAIRFAEFCREQYGVRSLYQLSPKHTKGYLQALQDKGVTQGHLINVESHLQKLQNGMQKFSEKLGKSSVTFIPGRQISPEQRELPKNRSYTPEEMSRLEEAMSPGVRTAMQMSVNLGLRAREVANIRVEHIVERQDGRLQVHIEHGKGVTKGGRFREIPVPARYEAALRQLIHGKPLDQKILKIKEGTLRSGLKRASDRSQVPSAGWHGFRHTYARERLEIILGDRIQEGKEMIGQMLENRSEGRKVDAGINGQEKELFQTVKDAINTVHHELGHGDNRWGLVAVYMS
jgi:integrase